MSDEGVMFQLVDENGRMRQVFMTSAQAELVEEDPHFLQILIDTLEPTYHLQPPTTNSPQPLTSQVVQSTNSPQPSTSQSRDGDSLFMWPPSCVLLLLERFKEHQNEFTDELKRHITIWQGIAAEIQEKRPDFKATGLKCKSKINGLKKTYKGILDHNSVSSNERRTWQFFDIMDEVFEKTGWADPKCTVSEVTIDTPVSQIPSSPQPTELVEPSAKRRKLAVVEQYLEQHQMDKEKRETVKEVQGRELLDRIRGLREDRQRQHQEKLDLLRNLLSKNN